MIGDALRASGHAFALIVDRAASVDPYLAALGVVLYLVAQAVRPRGWHTILRAAYPDATGLRPRNTMAAYLAGAGLNGVIPARGGDVVKLWLVHRRIDDARYPTLAATFVPETLFETAFGTALVAWALARGFLPVPGTSGDLPQVDVSLFLEHPVLATLTTAAVLALGVLVVRLAHRRMSDFAARVRQGLVILGHPRLFLTGVASWQALARLIRLASLAAFMQAFALPVTLSTVVLVMAAQGGGRIIPLAPASAGPAAGHALLRLRRDDRPAVDIAAITAFTFGVGALLLVAGLVVGIVALLAELGTWSPREALAAARAGRSAAARVPG